MRVLFVTWDGGGNLPPALGIAREVQRRGGTATFLGNAIQRAAVEAAGMPFAAFREGRDYDSAAPRSTLRGLADLTGLFADRGIGRDALAALATEKADVVVVDCLLSGAVLEIAAVGVSVVSLVHSQWQYFHGSARGPVGIITRLRGADPVKAAAAARLNLVTTRLDVEDPAGARPGPGIEHTGFVWQGSPVEAVPEATRPRVLVSFSTTSFPGQDRALQNVFDALDGLLVDVVATTGPLDPAALRAPAGARVERRIDHADLLPTTRLVIGHGGHGTTSRALAYGIPLLVMPMHPLIDQPAIGRAVERLGVGRMLPKSAPAARIRAAVESLLDDHETLRRARELGHEIRERDGAVVAADLLEHVTSAPTADQRAT
jgi:UDP:flavonoid glycosyltransferase YjiC (YdhE family)